MAERYDYSQNPHIQDFKAVVRGNPETHPWITKREEEIQQLFNSRPEIPSWVDPLLIPHEADQDIVLTPFDNYDGMYVTIPPKEYIDGWKMLREYYLKLANHPARIFSMQELEKRGFKRPEKMRGVIDEELEQGRLLQLADLGHAIDITNGLIQDPEILERIAQTIGDIRTSGGEEALKTNTELRERTRDVENWIDVLLQEEQSHRTELLASGPFTLIKDMACSFVGSGAMPDINGSVLAGVTFAKMFVPFGVPEIGKFSDPKKQAALAKAILDRLTTEDPLLYQYDQKTKEYIVAHWRNCVIGVTEVDREKSLHRAQYLADVGVTGFRPYGHTRGGDIIETTRELRREYPDALIISSQISGAEVALACEYYGADMIIIGVGSGGRCTTALISQLIPTNAPLPWKLRGVLGIPIGAEGGGIDEPIVATLAGISAVNGSGSVGGGCFEAPGGARYLTRDGKQFSKPYGGEASKRFKYLSKRNIGPGIPFLPEGEETMKQLIPLEESITQKVVNQWLRMILGSVVLGVDAGPFTIEAIQNLDPSPLWMKTRSASYIQNTH